MGPLVKTGRIAGSQAPGAVSGTSMARREAEMLKRSLAATTLAAAMVLLTAGAPAWAQPVCTINCDMVVTDDYIIMSCDEPSCG